MAETPLAQEVVADATYCTVGLTVPPLAGAETETPAKAKVPEQSTSRRANLPMKILRS
jgi:hypothetical protein